jgi:hypothetical protein
MLCKFVGAFLVVSSLILSTNAWAITATVTGQPTGQAEKGGTFTVVKQTPSGQVTRSSASINPTTHRATVTVKVKTGDRLYGSLDGGLTGKPITDEQASGTVPIDFSYGVGPIPQPLTYTGVPGGVPIGTPYDRFNPSTWTGFYIGGQGSGFTDDQLIYEYITGTKTISSTLQNSKGMGSVGVIAGNDFGLPGMIGATIGPVGSFNYVGQSNNNVFSNGAFIGNKTIWIADIGLKGEYWREDHLLGAYAKAGAEILNYDLQSNFTGPILMVNRTTVGAFFTAGVEATRPDWRWGNGQWTAFGELTFVYMPFDTVSMPVFSRGFDYASQNNQVRATGGFLYRLNNGVW